MLRYVITIVLITMLGVGEISAQSAKSDSLFAIGVDLYNAGKYQEAIPIFEQSDKLDKIELDLSSNRRDYSAMWLASCYYNLGDTVKAKSISDYYYINKPIDRRITIESDSIDMIKTNSREEVLSHRYTCASIEKDLLGSTNIWYGNTLMNILLDNFVLGKFEEINNVIIDLQPIFSANKIWAYEHYEMIVSITGKLMEIYSNEVQKRINLLNAVCNLSRIFYDLKYGDKFDFCYGAFISKLMEALAEANHLEEAIEVGENARNMMKTPLPIYNRSRNRILADLGTLYAKGHLDQEKQRDPSLSYDFMNKRWPIYEEAEDVIDKTEGKYSYDWSLLQIKKSNSYIWHPEHLDFEGCKQYLHNAFDAYSKISRDSIEKKLYLSLLLDDYHKFDLLNDEQSFIDYAYEILSPDTLISYNYVWAYIADAYNSNNVNRRDKAIEIYQYFYDHARSHNDEAEAIMFMKSKALAEYLLKRYEEAARDYLEIDALLKEAKEGYSPSNHGNILHDLALCYGSLLGLNDSLKYNAFNSKAIEYKKNAVHSNDNYNPSYSTINKIDDMINIAEWTETTFGNISSWKFVEGIKCYKEALDTVLIKKLEPTQLKYYLYRLYSTIGRNYIFLNNFEAANDYLGKALTISNDTLSYEYNGIMDQYAVLYDRVSIEPEIALHYYFRQVSLSEDRLKLMKNQLLPNAIITETDLLINNWNKCAEKFEYLGNNEDVLKCLDRKLELLKEQGSNYYFQEKIRRLEKELELFSPKALKTQFIGGEDFRKINNIEEGYERCKNVADEIVETYKQYKTKISAEDFRNIYYCYSLYTNDSVSSYEYLTKSISAIKKEHPGDYMYTDIYNDGIRDLARLKGEKEELEALILQSQTFSKNNGMKKEYALSLANIASKYSYMNEVDSALIYAMQYIKASEGQEELKNDAIIRIFEVAKKGRKYEIMISYYEQYLDIIKNLLLRDFRYETAEEREKSWNYYEFIPFSCAEMFNCKYGANIPNTVIYDNLGAPGFFRG